MAIIEHALLVVVIFQLFLVAGVWLCAGKLEAIRKLLGGK